MSTYDVVNTILSHDGEWNDGISAWLAASELSATEVSVTITYRDEDEMDDIVEEYVVRIEKV